MIDGFVVGVPRAGTTWIHEWMSAQREVAVPQVKEPNYFLDWSDRTGDIAPGPSEVRRRSVPDRDSYYRSFRSGEIRVDVSPLYMLPGVAERISRASDPRALWLITRDPLRRAWSHWTQTLGRRATYESFSQLLSGDTVFEGPYMPGRDFLRLSRFGSTVEEYRRVFGGRFHVVDFEDFRRNPERVASKIGYSLGLEHATGIDLGRRNSSSTGLGSPLRKVEEGLKSAAETTLGHARARALLGRAWKRLLETTASPERLAFSDDWYEFGGHVFEHEVDVMKSLGLGPEWLTRY